jgi:hypothetical protein
MNKENILTGTALALAVFGSITLTFGNSNGIAPLLLGAVIYLLTSKNSQS